MILRILICLGLMTTNAFAIDWTLDQEQSQLTFQGTQGGAPFEGSFERFSAEISLDPEDLTTSSIAVRIDTASASSGSPERDGALPGADWFDVASHPEASFTSTAISLTDDGYSADGTLTIKGTALPTTLPFTLTIADKTAHATGSLTIDRGDFGVGTGALSAMVGAEVIISFDITAAH
jgi:polyisoprenoid-binding protein YceI